MSPGLTKHDPGMVLQVHFVVVLWLRHIAAMLLPLLYAWHTDFSTYPLCHLSTVSETFVYQRPFIPPGTLCFCHQLPSHLQTLYVLVSL